MPKVTSEKIREILRSKNPNNDISGYEQLYDTIASEIKKGKHLRGKVNDFYSVSCIGAY